MKTRALLALLALATGCSTNAETAPLAPQPDTSPATTQTLTQELDQPQPHNDQTNEITSIKTDPTNPESVAEAFGCGWWAQPIRNETLQERTNRLKNLTSPEIETAIPELRNQPTSEIIESYHGNTTKTRATETDETYTIQCTTTHYIADNVVNGPHNRTATIAVTKTGNNWKVTAAQLAGLTLP